MKVGNALSTVLWCVSSYIPSGLNNLLAAYSDKSAYAQCIFAYSPGPGGEVRLFTGRTMVSGPLIQGSEFVYIHLCPQGTIVPARGPCNFGWDPVFQPDGFDKTYAELEPAVKNSISHRYKAVTFLKQHLITPPAKKHKADS